MTSPQKGEASRKRLPELPATTNQAAGYPFLGHEGYMRLLADRIRWLERRDHWWLRTEAGRPQRESLERQDAA